MGEKAAVLYDFEAQPGSNELNIHAGEILTITNRDIGEGWWEGINQRGEKGLFPESYVEAVAAAAAAASPAKHAPPAVAPPPLPTEYTASEKYPSQYNNDSNNGWSNPNATGYDDWGTQDATASSTYAVAPTQSRQPATAVAAAAGAAGGDEFFGDDDWDDSSDDGEAAGGKAAKSTAAAAATTSRKPLQSLESNASSSQEGGRGGTLSAASPNAAAAPSGVRLNLNRFSNFVKSGMENYLLGRTKATVPDDQITTIVAASSVYAGGGDGAGDSVWMPGAKPYTCEVFKPVKDTKLKGLKSFMVYQLEPSFTSVQVPRRYKHFDWLHARLIEKFLLVPVPTLPDKQISGRYQDEFLAHRQRRLQQWVSYVCRHPLLSECDVWKHFLTCTDEKRWKEGKRKAEKDELVGSAFLLSVKTPNMPLHNEELDAESDSYLRFVKSMDDAVRISTQHLSDNAKRHVGPFKREYQRLGAGFTQLGNSFEQDPKRASPALTEAVKMTGQVYEQIGELFAQQPKFDSEPLVDSLALFKGILSNIPETLTLQKAARQKVGECQKMQDEGKMPPSEQQPLQHRADVLSYAVMAEMNHFQSERVYQMKTAIQSYLDEQIRFYQQIVGTLQSARDKYDET